MDRSLIEIQAGYDEPMESDLNWLVRNVEGWPLGTNVAFVSEPDKDGNRSATFLWYGIGVPLDEGAISKEAWWNAKSKPDQIPQPVPSLQYRPEDVAFNSMDQMCGPEAYHRINHSEQPLDMVKQERYKDANGEDWIDEFAKTSTVEEFRGAMKFTIGKYNRRVGKKDEIIKEIRKMKDYCHRWELYELGLKHD